MFGGALAAIDDKRECFAPSSAPHVKGEKSGAVRAFAWCDDFNDDASFCFRVAARLRGPFNHVAQSKERNVHDCNIPDSLPVHGNGGIAAVDGCLDCFGRVEQANDNRGFSTSNKEHGFFADTEQAILVV